MSIKKRVAVLFGGMSPEHDISVISGLQTLHAIDTVKYDPFPVYISRDGTWFVGEQLFDRNSYIPDEVMCKKLTPVHLGLDPKGGGSLPSRSEIVVSFFKALCSRHRVSCVPWQDRRGRQHPGCI